MSEKTLHRAVCDYLRLQYPQVMFNSDLAGATKLTMGQAVAMKSLRSNRGFPDLSIYRPKIWIENFETHMYYGLFIELKKEGEKLYKVRTVDAYGNPAFISDHVAEQQDCITRLCNSGYYACFCIGYDESKKVIDWYLDEIKQLNQIDLNEVAHKYF